MRSNDIFIVFLGLFWIGLTLVFAGQFPALADDLTHYNVFNQYQQGILGFQEVFSTYFLEDLNRQSRPISSLAISLFTILSYPSTLLFFSWGILSFIYLFLLKNILSRYFNEHPTFIGLALLLSLCYPLSSANIFSVVMHSIQLIIGFFFISTQLIHSPKNRHHFWAGVVMLLSLLLYEQNIFLLPIIVFLTLYHFRLSADSIVKIFLSSILPVMLFAVYRIWIVKEIYPDYFDYGSSKIDLNPEKNMLLFGAFAKLFSVDYGYILYQSVLKIVEYEWYDFLLLGLGVLSVLFIIFNISPSEKKIKTSKIMMLVLCFILSILVFFVSYYPPIAFGFENRVLIWVRYSSSLLLAVILYHFLIGNYRPFWGFLMKVFVFIFLTLNIIAIISEKNSYILASEYNKKTIKKITKTFKNSNANTRILLLTEKERGKNFITDETLISANYEFINGLQLYAPESKLNGNNIHYIHPNHYNLYTIFDKKLNNREKSYFKVLDDRIDFGKRNIKFPFYLYDLEQNTIRLINNKKEFPLR